MKNYKHHITIPAWDDKVKVTIEAPLQQPTLGDLDSILDQAKDQLANQPPPTTFKQKAVLR